MSKPLSTIFARELRAVRQARGWTQADLAERAGIAVEVCGRLERGHVLPRADTLVRLAAALGVTTDALLGFASPKERLAAEPVADYGDPPELRRLVRRLRREPRGTIRHLDAFLSALQTRKGGRGGR